jgi:hypothetical protein
VEESNGACFIVSDEAGQALGYFYFEDEPRPASGPPLLGFMKCGHRYAPCDSSIAARSVSSLVTGIGCPQSGLVAQRRSGKGNSTERFLRRLKRCDRQIAYNPYMLVSGAAPPIRL